jgi:hypothetical protein
MACDHEYRNANPTERKCATSHENGSSLSGWPEYTQHLEVTGQPLRIDKGASQQTH